MSAFQIVEVKTSKELDEFLDVIYKIQEGASQNFVPPLRIAVKDTLDVQKNPFFRHAYRTLYIAVEDGKTIGRIAAIIDDEHNRYHNERSAFFGYFECVNREEVAKALFAKVEEFARERGMTKILGPMNPSTNNECALLIEGYDDPPAIMMTYNPPYYPVLVEKCGYSKAKDFYAYLLDSRRDQPSERLMAHVEKLKQAGRVTFRKINMAKFDDEVAMVREMYNDAWETNWGFVPMNEQEFQHMAKDLKLILDPELLLIAEVAGEPAGFGLALPDVNQIVKPFRGGRLSITNVLKLIWKLKILPKRYSMNRCRIIILGVKKKFQQLGIGPLLYVEYFKRGPSNGYICGEASWVLEDNAPMNRALTQMTKGPYKKYRIYERNLTA